MAPLAEVFNVGISLAADLGNFRRDTARGVGDAAEAAAESGGERFKRRFSAIANVAGLAIGGALAVGIAEGLQQQDANRLLAAQLGATPKEAERLGKLSGSLYAAGFGASMEDVNAALRGVVQNGIAGLDATDAAIQAAAANVTNLAALLGEDAQRVSSAVSQMLRTGLAKSATEAFDILTKATQNGINKSEDLLDTLNEYGTEFRELGINGQQALGLISQAIQAGARDSDTAADALKEFSIRAQDGSKLSAEAFAALGINAQQAFAAVAQGGAPSAAVLDLVLDKLRAMPASAERTALAVALFGTKAEDLADALFSMDLTTATAAFGDFEGAAQRAGDTMASSANAQVDTFIRSLKQDLVEAVAAVIPKLTMFGEWVNKNKDIVVPLATAVGTLAAVVWTVNAAMTAWAAISAVFNAVASISLVRTIANTVANAAYTASAYAIIVATGIWTVVQWGLNAALSFLLSPIGLVVIAIIALVAIIVIAWKNSETFRSVVLTSWEAIKTASIYLWENILKPIFNAWLSFAQVMGGIYLWLWREVIQPAMTGIGLVIQVAWVAIQIVFQLWRFWIMEVVVPAIMFLWQYAVKPVMDFIVAYIQLAWAAIKIVWDLLVSYIRNVIVPAYSFMWEMIKLIWGGISATISAVWTNAIKPVFDVIVKFITQDIPAAWRRGVDLIGFWWGALKDLAKAPVRFVIETVVNKGIIGTFNRIADFLPGLSRINPIDLPAGFAAGGYFDGRLPGPSSDKDNMVAVGPNGDAIGLATGEYVVNARSTARNLPLLDAINKGFADGGLIGAITNPAGWVRDQVGNLLDRIPGGGFLRSVGVAMGQKMIDGLISYAKSKLTFAGGGGSFGSWPSSPGAQRGDSGVWRAIVALINSTGPLSGSFGNGYRPGDPLWHGSGRAVDWMGFNQDALATFLASRRPLELIHRTASRDYAYTRGVNKGSFSQGLMNEHRNHIHAAFAMGGRVMDGGGPLHHGQVGINLSHQTEQVTPAPTMLTVVELLEKLIAAVERVAPGVGRVITTANAAGVATARTF